MSDRPAFEALFAKRQSLIKPGLDRMRRALGHLGPAVSERPTVLVGGTNGKGTTAAFLWKLHARSGGHPALFSSPHLRRFTERFVAAGGELAAGELEEALEQLRAQLPAELFEELSFFEISTLLALVAFDARGSEVNILEVGLGGRLDSTNVCPRDLSIITGVGLDHAEFLGETIPEVAREKAGIIRPGIPCFWGAEPQGEAFAVVERQAREKEAPLYRWGREFGCQGDTLFLRPPGREGIRWPLPAGRMREAPYLRRNAVLAAAALHTLTYKNHPGDEVSAWEAADRRLETALSPAHDEAELFEPPCLRARFETYEVPASAGPTRPVLLDVCHNPDGASAFCGALERRAEHDEGWQRPVGLVSILGDKDTGAILDRLREVFRQIFLFASQQERSWQREQLPPRHRELAWYSGFAEAWKALEAAYPAPIPVVVCGSVMAMGEVLDDLERRGGRPR